MYSQRDEEEVILKHLPATGRFIDIGAYGFKELSNTRALAEKGWSGVLVEPCPEECDKLIKNTKGFNVEIVNAVITPNYEGLIKFYASPNAVSSIDEAHVSVWKPHVPFYPIWAMALPVKELFEQFGLKFDFVSIDCEGISAAILKAIDLKTVGATLVCVEADKHETAITDYFIQQGYSVIHKTAENLIAKRN